MTERHWYDRRHPYDAPYDRGKATAIHVAWATGWNDCVALAQEELMRSGALRIPLFVLLGHGSVLGIFQTVDAAKADYERRIGRATEWHDRGSITFSGPATIVAHTIEGET